MSLRSTELEQVAQELQRSLTQAFVQKAWAPLPKLAYLELRQPGRSVLLCLSAESASARVSVATQRVPSPPDPSHFQRWVRQELIGRRLVQVSMASPWVMRFEFIDAEQSVRVLCAELRGTGANLLLLDGNARVLAASVQEGERTRPGAQWTLPEGADAPEGDAASRLRADAVADASFPFAEAAEALFGTRERERHAQDIRKKLTGPLRAKLARIDRTLVKVRAEADRTETAERHRSVGELLAQNLHRVGRGVRTMTLTRYTEAGVEEVEVSLDPKRSPKEEVEWHFHQYRRLLSGMTHAQRRIGELEAERERVRAQLDELTARESDALLEHDVALLSAPRKKGPERGKPYKEFKASTGARILVGRNATSNDALTFGVARPFDVWLHARGVPGSHVVLEGQKNQDPNPDALIDAAHLAHHHSQQKAEPQGEVAVTQVKFVKKLKGGSPGQVTFTRDRSVHVRIDPARLARLLRSASDADPAS